jgi:hypothetical protein
MARIKYALLRGKGAPLHFSTHSETPPIENSERATENTDIDMDQFKQVAEGLESINVQTCHKTLQQMWGTVSPYFPWQSLSFL